MSTKQVELFKKPCFKSIFVFKFHKILEKVFTFTNNKDIKNILILR